MNTLPTAAALYLNIRPLIIIAVLSIALVLCVYLNRPMSLFINQTADPNTHKVVYQVCAVQHRWGSQRICPPAGVGSEYQLAQFQLFQAQQSASGWHTTLNNLQAGK